MFGICPLPSSLRIGSGTLFVSGASGLVLVLICWESVTPHILSVFGLDCPDTWLERVVAALPSPA